MPGTSINPPVTDDAIVMEGTGTVTVPDQTSPANDTWTVRLVVIGLLMIALSIIVCATLLTIQDRELPETLLVLGGVCVGSLGSILVSSASKRT